VPARPRLAELDALRGLAALAVVLYHYSFFIRVIFPTAPLPSLVVSWGCYGVQLFFAISGFVILMTLDRTATLGAFARARFWRLYPTYWLAIVLTTLMVALLGPAKLAVGAGATLVNLSMVQTMLGVASIDGVYWSLNVELGFYLCMGSLWQARLLGRIEAVLLGWIALKWLWWAVPALPFGAGVLLVQEHIPYFAVGIVTYRVWSGQRRWFEQLPVLAAIAGTVLALDPTDAHPLILGLIAAMLALAAGRMRWIAVRPLRWLGTISYPLYLLHGCIGYALILSLEARGVPADAATLATLGVAMLLAAAVTSWFEPAVRGLAARGLARREVMTRFAN
jgi:peptidoglycan/LPS O-acetylase OafA/YrhL